MAASLEQARRHDRSVPSATVSDTIIGSCGTMLCLDETQLRRALMLKSISASLQLALFRVSHCGAFTVLTRLWSDEKQRGQMAFAAILLSMT